VAAFVYQYTDDETPRISESFLRQQTCAGTPKGTEQNLIVRSGKWNLIVV